jgi:wyosine [tRNA(Phe)-imidazoG37] synthetase (radical SAM superfamily)
MFVPPETILDQLRQYLRQTPEFDVVTIVGEGEPALYLGLGELIRSIRSMVRQPIAVITNGSLLSLVSFRDEIAAADIVLPSLDAFDEASYRRINRPHPSLHFQEVYQGLVDFSHQYQGQLWLEIMLMDQLNDTPAALAAFQQLLDKIDYHRLYINTPVRPPAEKNIHRSSPATIEKAIAELGGICIDQLAEGNFSSDNPDDYQAILGIIARHPMNQHEINSFLSMRPGGDLTKIIARLRQDELVETIDYMNYTTFRLRHAKKIK